MRSVHVGAVSGTGMAPAASGNTSSSSEFTVMVAALATVLQAEIAAVNKALRNQNLVRLAWPVPLRW